LLLHSEKKLNKLAEDKYLHLAEWREVDLLIEKKELEDQVVAGKDSKRLSSGGDLEM
jgi:hypothetical protein